MAMIMIEMLRESGWAATIVTPYSQLEHGWIDQEWARRDRMASSERANSIMN